MANVITPYTPEAALQFDVTGGSSAAYDMDEKAAILSSNNPGNGTPAAVHMIWTHNEPPIPVAVACFKRLKYIDGPSHRLPGLYPPDQSSNPMLNGGSILDMHDAYATGLDWWLWHQVCGDECPPPHICVGLGAHPEAVLKHVDEALSVAAHNNGFPAHPAPSASHYYRARTLAAQVLPIVHAAMQRRGLPIPAQPSPSVQAAAASPPPLPPGGGPGVPAPAPAPPPSASAAWVPPMALELDLGTRTGVELHRGIDPCLQAVQGLSLSPFAALWDPSLGLPANECQLRCLSWYEKHITGRKILMPLELCENPTWTPGPTVLPMIKGPGGILHTMDPMHLALDWFVIYQVCGDKMGTVPHESLKLGADPNDFLAAAYAGYCAMAAQYGQNNVSLGAGVVHRAAELQRVVRPIIQQALNQQQPTGPAASPAPPAAAPPGWQSLPTPFTGQKGGRFSSSPNPSNPPKSLPDDEEAREADYAEARRLANIEAVESDEPRNNDGRSTCFWCDSPTKEFMGLAKPGHVCTNKDCGR
jgi:hypothetical protein